MKHIYEHQSFTFPRLPLSYVFNVSFLGVAPQDKQSIRCVREPSMDLPVNIAHQFNHPDTWSGRICGLVDQMPVARLRSSHVLHSNI
jgi:hypothetical protein